MEIIVVNLIMANTEYYIIIEERKEICIVTPYKKDFLKELQRYKIQKIIMVIQESKFKVNNAIPIKYFVLME